MPRLDPGDINLRMNNRGTLSSDVLSSDVLSSRVRRFIAGSQKLVANSLQLLTFKL